jgi:hypothetical protein
MKKQDQRRYSLSTRAVIVIFSVSSLLFLYKVVYDVYYREQYCENEARQTTGTHWTKSVHATELDKKNWPGAVQSDGSIFEGMHEVLKCEEAHKAFVFF